jgi:hypothetical protein
MSLVIAHTPAPRPPLERALHLVRAFVPTLCIPFLPLAPAVASGVGLLLAAHAAAYMSSARVVEATMTSSASSDKPARPEM